MRIATKLVGQMTSMAASTFGAATGAAAPAASAGKGLLSGLPHKPDGVGTRHAHTVVWALERDAEGNVRNAGHIQMGTTPEEQEKYGVAATYGHGPVRPQDMARRSVSFSGADGQAMHVTSEFGVAKPVTQDKPMPASFRGVTVIDHGPLTPAAAKVLLAAQAKGRFHSHYDTVGQKAPNCVTFANQLHRDMGLTDVVVSPLTSPQDAAKLVEDSKFEKPVANEPADS